MPGVALKEEVPGETGADRDWGTETGAQRLAQTETPKISGDLLSFLTFAKSVYKAAIAQVEWCGGEQLRRHGSDAAKQDSPSMVPRLNE